MVYFGTALNIITKNVIMDSMSLKYKINIMLLKNNACTCLQV